MCIMNSLIAHFFYKYFTFCGTFNIQQLFEKYRKIKFSDGLNERD